MSVTINSKGEGESLRSQRKRDERKKEWMMMEKREQTTPRNNTEY